MGKGQGQNFARLRRSYSRHGRVRLSGLLLDTHVFLWYATDDPALPDPVRQRISTEQSPVYISIASAWEIAIKHGLGKLELHLPLAELLGQHSHERDIERLAISDGDVVAYARLGFPLANHRDPFDRMIAVQAQNHGLTLVTADSAFDAYGIPNLLSTRPE